MRKDILVVTPELIQEIDDQLQEQWRYHCGTVNELGLLIRRVDALEKRVSELDGKEGSNYEVR